MHTAIYITNSIDFSYINEKFPQVIAMGLAAGIYRTIYLIKEILKLRYSFIKIILSL